MNKNNIIVDRALFRDFLRLNNISQRKLAELTGVSPSSVCRLCKGERIGNIVFWLKVQELFHLDNKTLKAFIGRSN